MGNPASSPHRKLLPLQHQDKMFTQVNIYHRFSKWPYENFLINWILSRDRKGPINSGVSALSSFRASVSGRFRGMGLLVFSKFWNGVRNEYEELSINLVSIFFQHLVIVKAYIIFYIVLQIPCLGKMWFLRYRPKCYQPVRFQYFKINYIFFNLFLSIIFTQNMYNE